MDMSLGFFVVKIFIFYCVLHHENQQKEAVWNKKFVTELGVILSIEFVIPLYYDNNGVIALAKESRSH